MSRLGLTNIYLKSGVLLILFGLACGAAIFIVLPPVGGTTSQLLMWGLFGGFISGVVLWFIGRIKLALRRFGRQDARS